MQEQIIVPAKYFWQKAAGLATTIASMKPAATHNNTQPPAANAANTANATTTAMHTRFILLNTSHAGNVGAIARAMKVMGFDDMVLVQPRWADVLQRPEAIERASGATAYSPKRALCKAGKRQ